MARAQRVPFGPNLSFATWHRNLPKTTILKGFLKETMSWGEYYFWRYSINIFLTLTLTSESVYGSQFFHCKLLQSNEAHMYSSNFYEDSEFINHYRQKTSFICFFLNLKLQNFEIVGLFIPQGLWAEHILLKNASVIDVSTGLRYKIRHHPPFHSQSPSLPPTVPATPAPTAQSQWYRAFGSCDLLGQWHGIPGAKHRNLFRSAPLPPSCPVPTKPALPVEKKVSHSLKGYVKNTWNGAKRQWEK